MDTLYFGMKTPTGLVSEKDWADFVAISVAPHFAEGFTVWDAAGQWKDREGAVVKEPTKVMQIAHPDSRAAEEKLGRLIRDYKERFNQESVMRARGKAEIGF